MKHSARAIGSSLGDAISGIQNKFNHFTQELRLANRKIEELSRELEESRDVLSGLTHSPSTLRRHIAFYCHPDRGGDELLMRRINNLFDLLERAKAGQGATQ